MKRKVDAGRSGLATVVYSVVFTVQSALSPLSMHRYPGRTRTFMFVCSLNIQHSAGGEEGTGGCACVGRANGGWVQNRDFCIISNQARRFSYLPQCVSKPRTAAPST